MRFGGYVVETRVDDLLSDLSCACRGHRLVMRDDDRQDCAHIESSSDPGRDLTWGSAHVETELGVPSGDSAVGCRQHNASHDIYTYVDRERPIRLVSHTTNYLRADPAVTFVGVGSHSPAQTGQKHALRELIKAPAARSCAYDNAMAETADPFSAPFGTLFGEHVTVARGGPDGYSYSGAAEPLTELSLHPATHALHYGSTCFEGLKAHRQADGSIAIFRLDDHVARFRNSITLMRLPVPDADLVRSMMVDAAVANADVTPPQPGALYLRPTIIGSDPNIGAAAAPSQTSVLYVLTSPVGDYFAGGIRPLSLLIETKTPRTTPQFGSIKSGANYAMALGPTLDAKAAHGVDQVLFATDGDTTETGAANFFLIDDDRIITRNLDSSFLHGITRASIIAMAADLGYAVEERSIAVSELLERIDETEMFLSGTAAVVAPVGTLISEGSARTVRDGQPGPNTLRLRQALVDVQSGAAEDRHAWRTTIA